MNANYFVPFLKRILPKVLHVVYANIFLISL
jgi:hypothetical protein